MRVFSYIRVSGMGQVDKDGPVRQKQAIENFAKSNGLIISGEFGEEGVSGTKEGMDRPKFAEMLARTDFIKECGAKELFIDGIVVESMDRLARDLMVSEILLRECRDRQLKVFCADQGTLVDMAAPEGDPMRKLIRQILGAVAEFDKSVTVKKLRGARERMRLNGRCEGRKPYGFKPGEQEILVMIERWKNPPAGLEKLDYAEIAVKLNEGGFKSRMGKAWNKFSVYTAYTGRRIKAYKNRKREIEG